VLALFACAILSHNLAKLPNMDVLANRAIARAIDAASSNEAREGASGREEILLWESLTLRHLTPRRATCSESVRAAFSTL